MTLKRSLCSFVIALGIVSNSDAGQRVLDLSSPSGTKISLTASPGEVVTFALFNKLPVDKVYTVTVEERVIPIAPFDAPTPPLGGFADDACDPILEDAMSLGKATEESQVAETVRKIRQALAAGTCTTPAKLGKINEWLARTIQIVPGQYMVRAGAEIVLTVIRDEKTWMLVVSGGPRGMWLTTYGVSIVPSRDKPYFAKALEDEKFSVTAETEIDDVRLIPSMFFSWLPRKRMLGDFSVGPTAGLGLSKNAAAVFGGVGLTYNWNLAFITGFAVSPHTRLRGRFQPGQEITENLDEAQLNRNVFRPTWLFAMTFRFASNPFGAGNDEGDSEEQSAEEKKKLAEQAAAEKKAAEEKAAAEKKAAEEKKSAEEKKKKGGTV